MKIIDGEWERGTFINAILRKGKLVVPAEQAATVTRILEGIYRLEETGKPVYFVECDSPYKKQSSCIYLAVICCILSRKVENDLKKKYCTKFAF